jgi:anti-sigma regulatory factor (Ser/Thr protein kinase)
MELPARAENVGLLRAEASAQAAELGMSASGVADLKTVVSEACANVVNYAYDEDVEGPLEVELVPEGECLNVFIRDQGGGIRPRPETDVPSLKLGLPLIGALSQRFDLSSEAGRGTELKIVMSLGA